MKQQDYAPAQADPTRREVGNLSSPPAREPAFAFQSGIRRRLEPVTASLLKPQGALSVALVALVIALTATSKYFMTGRNITSILEGVADDGIIAAFSTMVMIMGGLDLSAVGVAVLASTGAGIAVDDGHGILLAVLLALFIGVVFGAVNSVIITVIGINAFVATLATWLIASGVAYVISSGQSQTISDSAFLDIAGDIPFGGVPVFVFVMVACYLVVYFILRTTRYGEHLYAIGGGAQAAALSGVRVRRIQVRTYMISAVMAAVAGVFLASWSQASVPNSTASNDLLIILAAVILGGVSLSGGSGTAYGTFLGICFLGVVDNALVLWQISDFYQPVVTGVVLILAVTASALRQRRSRRG